MSELTKQQLTVENNSSFPNNNTGFITPTLLRTFNQDMIDSMVDEVTYNADSASWETDILALQQFSASLTTNFVTPTELSASSSTLQNNINTKLNTASFNAYTASETVISASFNSRINAITGSSVDTGSLVTTASFNTYTQSAAANTSASINAATQSLSASVAAINAAQLSTASFNTYTASAATNVSGAINSATQSLSSSVAAINAQQLITASAVGDTITFTKGNGSTFPVTVSVPTGSLPAGVVSSSAQIAGFGYATTSSVSQSVSALNAATSSYITSAQTASMTVLSASFAQTASFLLGSVASASFATSASFAVTASRAQEVVVRARNGNPSTLGAGTVVRIVSAVGDNPIFNTASFVDEAQSSNTLGVLQNSIASGADGDVVITGTVFGVNTDPALGYVAGDVIYLSSSGQFTRVQPQAPQNIVVIGEVLRAQQNNGSINVSIQNGWELNELHNVRIISASQGNLLAYNSASALWENSSSAQLGLVNTSSFNSYTASAATNVSGAINTATGSSVVTASIAGNTITFTKGDGNTFPIVVPSGGSGSVDTGSFATTGSNTFLDKQTINLTASAETTAIGILGNADKVLVDMYVEGGNYDTFNVLVSASNGIQLRDYNLTLNAIQPFISVDTDGGNMHLDRRISAPGNNPAGVALEIVTGSVAITPQQGTGYFYSNLPMTSSGLRINGTALVADLIVSGVFGGNSSLQVLGNASISGTLTLSSSAAIELSVIGGQSNSGSIAITGSAPTQLLTSGGLTLSGSLLTNVTDIYTGSNNANFVVTLGSASMASLLAAGTTNPNTLYFVI